jgi:heavy metal efflux system protein
MIDQIIHYSVRNKVVIGMLIVCWMAWGLYSASQITIDALPDITNNQVQISTFSPALATEDVERLVTAPIELALAHVPEVEEVRSLSRAGLSFITVVYNDNVETSIARQRITEQLQTIQIPPEYGTPTLMPVTTGLGEVYQYSLRVDPKYQHRYGLTDLRTIQDWAIKRQLVGIPGVIEVSTFGGERKQYQVSIIPERIQALDLSIIEVYQALSRSNANAGGSTIEKGSQGVIVRTEGLLTSTEDIENVYIRTIDGIPITIRDIAKVEGGNAIRFGAMTQDGHGEVVGGIILMLKGSSALNVIRNVKDKMEVIQRTLPPGITIEPFIDRAALIQRIMTTVAQNLVEGGIIVIFVLVLFLGNLRAGLVVASVIPLSLLFAFGVMYPLGLSANLMSLGAIDFGLIVDGAVIIVESVVSRLHLSSIGRRLTNLEQDNIVIAESKRVRHSAAFGELIILVVYLPIVALTGIEGKMFRPMALTVGFALLGALLLSFTYVPMVSAWLLKPSTTTKKTFADRLIDFLLRIYQPAQFWTLRHPKTILLIAATSMLLALWLITRLGAVFIPTLEEGDFALQISTPAGSSLAESIRQSSEVENILKQHFPEVITVVSKIGSAEIPTDPMAIEDSDMMIVLKPRKQWTTAQTRDELAQLMKDKINLLSGHEVEVTQPIQLRFNELMTGVKSDIAIKIYGNDLHQLADLASKAKNLISPINGVGDIRTSKIEELPQLVIKYDRSAMARMGVNVDDLNQTIETAMAGKAAGVIFEQDRRFDLVVRLAAGERVDPKIFERLYIRTAANGLIRISSVASVNLATGPTVILREWTQRFVTIGINVRNRDISSLVAEVEGKLRPQLPLPTGYSIRYGGQFENLQSAQQRLMVTLPIALGLIMLLLYFTFNSIVQAFLIFSAIPIATFGGVVALTLRGMPFSISAAVGFIVLFGVVVLNGIVLLAYFNELKQKGMNNSLRRVVVGCQTRLRPVLMTATVASMGFLPMAISTSAGAEVQQPLATVVIGGLISATLLTLFVLPILYLITEKSEKKTSTSNTNENTNATFISKSVLILCAWIGVSTIHSTCFAQVQVVSLGEAESMVLSSHPLIQGAQLSVQAAQQRTKTASSLAPTSFNWQQGQINSAVWDHYVTIMQPLPVLPVIKAERRIRQQEVDKARLTQQIQANALKHQLYSLYYRWLVTKRKQLLMDTFLLRFARSVKIAQLRFQTGESNMVSQAAMEAKAEAYRLSQLKLEGELIDLQTDLQALLASGTPVIPDINTPLDLPKSLYPTDLQNRDTLLQSLHIQRQAQLVTQARLTIDRLSAQRSPQFAIGYFNQQLDRVGGYQGLMIDVAIPIWLRPQQAAIKGAEIELKREEVNFNYQQLAYNLSLQRLQQHIKLHEREKSVMESSILVQLRRINEVSFLQFQNGEISYIEHLYNTGELMAAEQQFLDTTLQLIISIIDAKHLMK